MPLFGVDVGRILNSGIKGASSVTLVKTTPGTRTGGSLTGGHNPTSTSYSCRGWIESSRQKFMDDSLTEYGDKYVTILSASLPSDVIPEPGDLVTIENVSGSTVVWVDQDPARSVWWLKVRN